MYLLWKKQEIYDIFDKHYYIKKRYPAKTKLLHKKFRKFACIDVVDIEHLLRWMKQQPMRTEYEYSLNK